MAVYLINSYDIVDIEAFKAYGPKVFPILMKYGAEVLASDVEGVAIEGNPKRMNAIIRFPSEKDVWDCYNDIEYQKYVRKLRIDSTKNTTMVMVKQFEILAK
jgi:uncharacterized protein (DUF1330 family)